MPYVRYFCLIYILAGLGLIGTWWGMAMAYGGINAVDAAPYMWPGLDALLTVCIVTQVCIYAHMYESIVLEQDLLLFSSHPSSRFVVVLGFGHPFVLLILFYS